MARFIPSLPQLFMLIGMGLMIYILWRRSNRHFGKGGTAYRPQRRVSALEKGRDLALCDAPPEVTRWQVEMHETARDLKAEVDTKLALLQILIQQSNSAAERLEQAIAIAEQKGIRTALDPLAAIDAWREDDADAPPSPPAELAPPQSNAIYVLADQGYSAASIAHETGLPLGDVELVISLRAH
jgi:hypothetical protein